MVSTASSPLKVPVLCGPTASGKTAIALELARRNPRTEIINCDSLLVYRHFDIGTAKPTAAERAQARHHLIDIREPEDRFDAADFVRAVAEARADIEARGQKPLLVGGTGFYLKALLFGLWEGPETHPEFRATLQNIPNADLYRELEKADPISALRIGRNDRYRLIRSLEILKFSGKTPTELQAQTPTTPTPEYALHWLDRADDELETRIQTRTELMLKDGWVEETQRLRAQYPTASALACVGYAQIIKHCDGILPAGRKLAPGQAGLASEINLATRQLVKNQRTFMRGLAKKLPPEQFHAYTLDQDREKLLTQLE